MTWSIPLRRATRRFLTTTALAALGVALAFPGGVLSAAQADVGTVASGQQFIVLNPTGAPPPIERKAMAERPTSLDGKTVYLVDVTFNGGELLLQEMQKWMTANLPTVKTVLKTKRGVYAADDPELWREIQAAEGLMIMAIGH